MPGSALHVFSDTSLNHPQNSVICLHVVFLQRNMKFGEIISPVQGARIQTQIYIHLNLRLFSQCLQCIRETQLVIVSLWSPRLLFSKYLLMICFMKQSSGNITFLYFSQMC